MFKVSQYIIFFYYISFIFSKLTIHINKKINRTIELFSNFER